MKQGIDVSEFQGKLTEEDWQQIKDSGVKFAILRIGFTGYGKAKSKQKDKQFENNYALCKKVGLPVGVYWYSCAVTEEEAISEAEKTLGYLKDKKLEYPIYIDTEDNHDIKKYAPESQYSIGKERLTKVIKAYCEYIEKNKWYVGIYSYLNWFYHQLILEDLKSYDKWIAQWAPKCTYEGSYGMWQYTNDGQVIGKRVDKDESYYDFESIMKQRGLNGYGKEEQSFKVGDKVKIIGIGNANSNGTGRTAKGIGWEREILKIYANREYPYQVGNIKGTTGFYKVSSLKKI